MSIHRKQVCFSFPIVWGCWFLRSSHNLPFSIDPCNRMVWSILIIFASSSLVCYPFWNWRLPLCCELDWKTWAYLALSCQINICISCPRNAWYSRNTLNIKYTYVYLYIHNYIFIFFKIQIQKYILFMYS